MPKFLDKIVIASIILTIFGGAVAVIFQWVTGMELSPTLIQYWFTVFGIELGATTLITLTKTLTKTYEKKVELQLMDKYKITPEKEDLKLNNELMNNLDIGDSYMGSTDFDFTDEADGCNNEYRCGNFNSC